VQLDTESIKLKLCSAQDDVAARARLGVIELLNHVLWLAAKYEKIQ
jgi:hypothetical protein